MATNDPKTREEILEETEADLDRFRTIWPAGAAQIERLQQERDERSDDDEDGR